MRLFSALYTWTMGLARHPRAEAWLAGLSFAESSFFPIPPDVMLAPMTLARPERWLRLAAVTTLASVAGGLAGWGIGLLSFDAVAPWVQRVGWWDEYETARDWFAVYGAWAIFIAGFSPIPYKIFTIAAGTVAMPLLPFVLASCVGRGARFLLVAGLMRTGGARMEAMLRTHIDRIGWVVTALVVVGGYVAWRWG